MLSKFNTVFNLYVYLSSLNEMLNIICQWDNNPTSQKQKDLYSYSYPCLFREILLLVLHVEYSFWHLCIALLPYIPRLLSQVKINVFWSIIWTVIIFANNMLIYPLWSRIIYFVWKNHDLLWISGTQIQSFN